MKKQDFNARITVNAKPKETLKKIAQVNDWWAKDFTGKAEKLNDTFTIRFGEVIADKKIVWHVTDSYLPWLRDKKEWNDTEIVYELSPDNNQTQVDFTHLGLVPGIECYERCEKGWKRFATISLPKFVNEGMGLPE